jgi:ABC-type uncharacterized transport system permease subunit
MTEANPAATGMNLDPMTLLGSGRLRQQVLATILAIILGLALGGLLVLLAAFLQGRPFDAGLPLTAYRALLDGSLLCSKGFEPSGIACQGDFLDLKALGNTLNIATPLILAGLSVAFGFRAGLFNIGAQGQFLVGAFVAAIFASQPIVSGPLHIVVALVAGFVGGAAWGFIPGLLKAWRGAHEVVVTIMLNFVAYQLLNLLAASPSLYRDPGASSPRTREALPDAQLPILLDGTRAHWGFIVALLAATAVWFLLFRTTLGFEIRTVGINAFAARYAGIRTAPILVLTMSLAGGLAGLGGGSEILGIVRAYPAEFLTNYGFDAIAVALLGRAHPFGVVGGALLFGALRAGAGTMSRATNMPADIVTIIQALIILFVAAEVILRRLIPSVRSRRPTPAAAAAAA